jgi:hypothetical protein
MPGRNSANQQSRKGRNLLINSQFIEECWNATHVLRPVEVKCGLALAVEGMKWHQNVGGGGGRC